MTQRKMLMPFFMLGEYDDKTTMELLGAAVRAGSDYLELGVPHTDPLADGAVLRQAAEKAIKAGMRPDKAIALAGEAVRDFDKPVYLLVYLNTLFGYGVQRFIDEIKAEGITGLVIPDLPLEAQKDIESEFDFTGVAVASFTSPTSASRLEEIAARGTGIVYSVNYTGITGSDGVRATQDTRVKDNYTKLKALTERPVLAGFGIDGPEAAKEAVKYADGVIIGTKLCKVCASVEPNQAPDAVFDFLSGVREVLDI